MCHKNTTIYWVRSKGNEGETSRNLGWSNSMEKGFRSMDFGRGLEEGEEEP
jgi:hypothetical protein